MGLVEYAASTCLATTGFALAAPFLETKIPAIEPVTKQIDQYAKFLAAFGVGGGALGVLLSPLLLAWSIYQAGFAANLLLFPLVAMLLVGCVGSIVLGVVLYRRAPRTEPHSGEVDQVSLAGFAGMAYGGLLWMVFTVALALS